MQQQIETVTENLRAKGILAKIVRQDICVQKMPSLKRRLQNISGLIILKQRKISGTRLNTKNCMNGGNGDRRKFCVKAE